MDEENVENRLRPMHCELNILTRSDGSAMLTQGETAVVVSVNGPIEVKLQNLDIDKAHCDVLYKPKCGLGSVTDRSYEKIVGKICESVILMSMYPKTAINIQIQEMENRGGLIACCINATCLALLNSGIDMQFLVAAVNCAIDEEGNLILDPDHKTTQKARANLTFAFDSIAKETISVSTAGIFSVDEYKKAFNLCRNASENVFKFYKDIVEQFSRIF